MSRITNGDSRTALAARAVFDDGRSALACRISLSITGGRLVLEAPSALPRQFLLEVPDRNKVYRAELRWTSRDAAGVKFLADAAPAPDTADHADLLREVAALKRRNAELEAQLAVLSAPAGQHTGAAADELRRIPH